MFAAITNVGAFLSLLVAFFKDYLKVKKMWPRKHEQAVADSISITALLIGLTNSIPYLLLVMFVYKDWLVTARTLSDFGRALLTLLIAVGYWVETNRGVSVWTLFLRSIRIGRRPKARYEIILVPQNDVQTEQVKQHLPELSLVSRRGGQVFVVETCDSPGQVETITAKYQHLGVYVTAIPVTEATS